MESRLSSNVTDSEQRRDSKPIRIRRPGRSPVRVDTRTPTPFEAQGNGNIMDRDVRGQDSYEDKGQKLKRGGSLLDRLALDVDSPSPVPSTSSPSLRDRVDVPMKRGTEDISDLTAVPMASGNLDGEGEGGGKGRTKRRNGKSRRGRKGAAP